MHLPATQSVGSLTFTMGNKISASMGTSLSKMKIPTANGPKSTPNSILDVDFIGKITDLAFGAHKLVYTADGKSRTTDCCIVTIASPTCDVKVGDILISINGVPLLNNGQQDKDCFFQEYLDSTINSNSNPKTIRFLRTTKRNRKNTPGITYMTLDHEEATMIYHEYWMQDVQTDGQNAEETPVFKSELTTRMQDLQSEKLKYIAEMRLEANSAASKDDKIHGTIESLLESVVAEQVEKEISRIDNAGHMRKLAELEAKMKAKDEELRKVGARKTAAAEEERQQAHALNQLELISKEENDSKERERLLNIQTESAAAEKAAKLEQEIQQRVDEQLQTLLRAKLEEYDQKFSELKGGLSYDELVKRKAVEESDRAIEEKLSEDSDLARLQRAEERAERALVNKATFEYANERNPASAFIIDTTYETDYLGLHVSPYVVHCPSMTGALRTIDCCVVRHSDLYTGMMPGDILISVNDLPLRSYREEGAEEPHPEFYPACLSSITSAKAPRVIRHLRLPSDGHPINFVSRDVGSADAILLLSDT